MTLFQALILGIVQGATEFLPISSSGHLVLVPWLLNWSFEPRTAFVFNVLVQWGTTAAVIILFRHDLAKLVRAAWDGLLQGKPLHHPQSRLAWLMIAASLPATFVGILLKRHVTVAFESPRAVSFFLLITAALLFLSERILRSTKTLFDMLSQDALFIGFAQALALFPGISRSGSTIAGGLARGLKRFEAARFSFLIGIPVMIGAGIVAAIDMLNMPNGLDQIESLFVGFAGASVVGYLAIRWLLGYLERRPLNVFAMYCVTVGIVGLILDAIRG
jgi:undecaprenyl-diphosphatase